ncbi:hypothetical protein KAU33_15610 [Candidatus Dependentiae bacterium]|nr:hypothetical protein [Candidatus Dependentiae bacterium]
MDTLLPILGIIVLSFVGAILVLLYKKEDYKKALVPGTVALIVVFSVSFLVTLEVWIALAFALLAGAVAQVVLPEKE